MNHRDHYAMTTESKPSRMLLMPQRPSMLFRCSLTRQRESSQVCYLIPFEKHSQAHFNLQTHLQRMSSLKHQCIYLKNLKQRQPWKSTTQSAHVQCSFSMAFHGDKIQRILLSDIFICDLPLPNVTLDFKVLVSIYHLFSISILNTFWTPWCRHMLYIWSKERRIKTGCTNKHGSFRHWHPELCSIGALAFYLFSIFHIIGLETCNFKPDYSNEEADKIGFQSWYELFLFTTGKDSNTSISYKSKSVVFHSKLFGIDHKYML